MNAGALFLEMITAGVLSDGMTARIEAAMSGKRAPGHFRPKDLPAPLWPTVAVVTARLRPAADRRQARRRP